MKSFEQKKIKLTASFYQLQVTIEFIANNTEQDLFQYSCFLVIVHPSTTARIVSLFRLRLLEARVLHKGAWVGVPFWGFRTIKKSNFHDGCIRQWQLMGLNKTMNIKWSKDGFLGVVEAFNCPSVCRKAPGWLLSF